jgi:hypothetical protein
MPNLANKKIADAFKDVLAESYKRYATEKPVITLGEKIDGVSCISGFKEYVAMTDNFDDMYSAKIRRDKVLNEAFEMLAMQSARSLAEIFNEHGDHRTARLHGVRIFCWLNWCFNPAWPECSHYEAWFGVSFKFTQFAYKEDKQDDKV